MRSFVITTFLICALFAPSIWANEIIKVTWNSPNCSIVGGTKEIFQIGTCYNYNSTGNYPSSSKYSYAGSLVFYYVYFGFGCTSNVMSFTYNASTCVQNNATSSVYIIDQSTSFTSATGISTTASVTSSSTGSSTTSPTVQSITNTFYSTSNCTGNPAIVTSYQLYTCLSNGDGTSSVYSVVQSIVTQCVYYNTNCQGTPSCTNLGSLVTCIPMGTFSYTFNLTSTPVSTASSSSSSTSFATAISSLSSSTTAVATSATTSKTSTVSSTTGGGQQLLTIQTFNDSTCTDIPDSSTTIATGECYYLDGFSMRYFVFGTGVDSCAFTDILCSETQKCRIIAQINTCTSAGSLYYMYTVSYAPTTPPVPTSTTRGQTTAYSVATIGTTTNTTADATSLFAKTTAYAGLLAGLLVLL